MPVTIDALTVADEPGAWSALGFAVEDGTCTVSEVRIRLAGRDAGRGLTGWSLRDTSPGSATPSARPALPSSRAAASPLCAAPPASLCRSR